MSGPESDDPVCGRCGRRCERDAAAAVALLGWASERVDGRQDWLCPECARRHVRDIESKLPGDYW